MFISLTSYPWRRCWTWIRQKSKPLACSFLTLDHPLPFPFVSLAQAATMPRPTSTSSSAASWLSQLPANPIFDLPTRSTTSELPRPASPQLSHLFPAPSLAKRARTAADNSGEAHRTSRMVLARGVDLIVAVGQELRLSSLAEAKGHYEDSEVFTGSANGYKVS